MAEIAEAPALPDGVALVRAPNPGPMTLDGTNSWVLRAPGARGSVVIDPGPADAAHLDRLAEGGVELVLVTHRHPDHTDAVDAFADLTGAPVRAIDAVWCRGGAPLADGERVAAGGMRLEVLATPGHTSDSMCVVLRDRADAAVAVFTGDTVLGRGTSIIAHPDGALGPYLDSLHRLLSIGAGAAPDADAPDATRPVLTLPGHGPVLPTSRASATPISPTARNGSTRCAVRSRGSEPTRAPKQ
ncbi:MBL fold metallo-hydrolase [Agromyces marinus]|uniref:MBL fold metallo-hydrolase n=1 Tax=Agromyces marinus TaxID=1389020 RepID=A0ABM8GZN7_9MICO|nr:MBL fold metallo-hydrolase [Agromyces marinus]